MHFSLQPGLSMLHRELQSALLPSSPSSLSPIHSQSNSCPLLQSDSSNSDTVRTVNPTVPLTKGLPKRTLARNYNYNCREDHLEKTQYFDNEVKGKNCSFILLFFFIKMYASYFVIIDMYLHSVKLVILLFNQDGLLKDN